MYKIQPIYSEFAPNLHLAQEMLNHCILALEKLIPVCKDAGIPVARPDAYDEWERLVEQCFDSFVIMAITDGGTMAHRRFKRLGFAVSDEAKTVLVANQSGENYFLDDLFSNDGKNIEMEWVRLKDSSDCAPNMHSTDLPSFSDFRLMNISLPD